MNILRVATYNIHKGVQGVGPQRRLEIHNLGHAVEQLDADIVCLQEVQFERRPDGVHELPGWLRLSGYEYVIPAQEQMAQMAARNDRVLRSCTAIGNALLYRTDRLMDVDAKKPRVDATTRVCMCLRGRPATALEPLGGRRAAAP